VSGRVDPAASRFPAALAGVLALAFALRAWNPAAGLPSVLPPEDPAVAFGTVRLALDHGTFGPLRDGAFSILTGLAGIFLWIFRGDVPGGPLAAALADPIPFWTAGRLVAALFGAATVALLAGAAQRAGLGAGRWVATLLLSVAAAHVAWSRLFLPDVAGAFFAVAALRGPASSGARAGLAAAAWLAGAPFVALALALVVASDATPRGRIAVVLAATALAAALDPAGAVGRLAGAAGVGPASARAFLDGLVDSVAPASAVLAGLGAAWVLRRGGREVRAHAVFALGAAVAAIAAGDTSPRAGVALLPSVALLAAVALERLARTALGDRRRAGVAVLGVGVVLVAEPAADSVAWVRAQRGPDTRDAAAAWLADNVAHQTSVVVPAAEGTVDVARVPLPRMRPLLRDLADRAAAAGSARAWWWELLAEERVTPPVYDVLVVDEARGGGGLDVYREVGAEFVVLPAPGSASLVEGTGGPHAEATRRGLRAELVGSPEARLEATFRAGGNAARGPDLEIWRITGGAAPP